MLIKAADVREGDVVLMDTGVDWTVVSRSTRPTRVVEVVLRNDASGTEHEWSWQPDERLYVRRG